MSKVFRSPDGLKAQSTGSAQVQQQQPTIVSFRGDGSLTEKPGKGITLTVGVAIPGAVDLYGYGFQNADLELIPNPAVPPPTPMTITNISVTPEVGITPGVIDFEFVPGTPVVANIGQYFLVVTDLVTGLRDLMPVRVYGGV